MSVRQRARTVSDLSGVEGNPSSNERGCYWNYSNKPLKRSGRAING
jgi:hypothetical protein